jgi:integrase
MPFYNRRTTTMTLRDVLNRYAILQNLTDRTVVLYGHTLDRFAEHLGHEPCIDDIDDLVVAGFLRWRAATPRRRGKPSAASVAKDKSQLTALANWAAKKRMKRLDGTDVEFLSLPRMRKIRHAPQAYTAEEVARLIRLAKCRIGQVDGHPAAWWWSTLLYAAWCSGERIGALLGIKWQDVDLDGQTLLFRAETRKGRCSDIQRAITPDLAAMLRMRAGKPEALVWRWDRSYHSLWPSLRLLCRRAGVRGTGFHRLRKSSASYVALGGGDATEHLGHSSSEMTRQHYLDPRITQSKKALDYLPRLDLDARKEDPKPPAA